MFLEKQENEFSFHQSRVWFWVLTGLIFLIGLAVRLYDLNDLPLDFHPTRQLHSALIARGMYYQDNPALPAWQREMAVQQWKLEGIIEPPIMEWMAFQAYRLTGSDILWIPRIFSIVFWMLGSIGLFLLAKMISDLNGALFSLAYFLILPYAVISSRAFQPDPMMTALIIFAWWAFARWLKRLDWQSAILAGILGGLAILSKSVAVFFIGGAWLGGVIAAKGLRSALRSGQVWTLGFLTVIPYGLYHIYGMFIAGFLQGQFSLRFFPEMWLQPAFYLRWIGKIDAVVGLEWFLAALLGAALIVNKTLRGMWMGVWAGYFVFALTFPHHISTHDYYQIVLIPIIAIGLGMVASVVLRKLRGTRWLLVIFVSCLILGGVILRGYDTRNVLKRTDYRAEAVFWAQLGEQVGHETQVAALTEDYGARLEYWGWVTPSVWITEGDMAYRNIESSEESLRSYFNETAAGKDFFLVTLLDEWDRQSALKDLLTQNYPVVSQSDRHILFDLRVPLTK